MKRRGSIFRGGVLAGLVWAASASGHSKARWNVPATLELPAGFNPEGISSGPLGSVFVGSIGSGAVYQASTISGEGQLVVPAQEGRAAIGVKWDWRSQLLYVAGGPTGSVFVYDSVTGESVAALQATTEASFVNDAVVTKQAVYFTDSFRPVLYKLALGRTGVLAEDAQVEELPLSGDFEFVEGQFNANGIVASRSGRYLFIVSSVLGTVYRVDTTTGEALTVDLQGASVSNGDGLFLQGNTLFVVQNADNQIAAIRLNRHGTHGTLVRTLTNEQFDVPTTITKVGNALYAVNARFGTEVLPDTSYDVVRVPLRP